MRFKARRDERTSGVVKANRELVDVLIYGLLKYTVTNFSGLL